MKSFKVPRSAALVGILLLSLSFIFLLAAKFSTTKSRFECLGKISSSDGGVYPITLYLELMEYRWWVGLWSESDAALHLEVPNTYIYYFENVRKVGHQYQIFDSKSLKGHFSNLSKALALQLPLKSETDFFDGVCKKSD